ncbi:MAG: hypothetical protein SPK00_10315 [Corynebacterium glucuronolyticum]|nr:hypothetical protein [Mycobacteriaceae bacterium]MDY5835119.1 hypothetical protein [Corynebacterium glucuronolyticum]
MTKATAINWATTVGLTLIALTRPHPATITIALASAILSSIITYQEAHQ